MSADKTRRKVEIFVDWLEERVHLYQHDREAIAAELRRIPALEAERDQLHAEVMEQARLLGMSGERELSLRAEIDRLRKDADALRADAERYRWLREQWVQFYKDPFPSPFETVFRVRVSGLDAAIDAAREIK